MNKQQGEALITEIERKRARTHPVKTIIVVERDGESARRVLYEDWLKTLTIEEIAEDTVQAVKKIE